MRRNVKKYHGGDFDEYEKIYNLQEKIENGKVNSIEEFVIINDYEIIAFINQLIKCEEKMDNTIENYFMIIDHLVNLRSTFIIDNLTGVSEDDFVGPFLSPKKIISYIYKEILPNEKKDHYFKYYSLICEYYIDKYIVLNTDSFLGQIFLSKVNFTKNVLANNFVFAYKEYSFNLISEKRKNKINSFLMAVEKIFEPEIKIIDDLLSSFISENSQKNSIAEYIVDTSNLYKYKYGIYFYTKIIDYFNECEFCIKEILKDENYNNIDTSVGIENILDQIRSLYKLYKKKMNKIEKKYYMILYPFDSIEKYTTKLIVLIKNNMNKYIIEGLKSIITKINEEKSIKIEAFTYIFDHLVNYEEFDEYIKTIKEAVKNVYNLPYAKYYDSHTGSIYLNRTNTIQSLVTKKKINPKYYPISTFEELLHIFIDLSQNNSPISNFYFQFINENAIDASGVTKAVFDQILEDTKKSIFACSNFTEEKTFLCFNENIDPNKDPKNRIYIFGKLAGDYFRNPITHFNKYDYPKLPFLYNPFIIYALLFGIDALKVISLNSIFTIVKYFYDKYQNEKLNTIPTQLFNEKTTRLINAITMNYKKNDWMDIIKTLKHDAEELRIDNKLTVNFINYVEIENEIKRVYNEIKNKQKVGGVFAQIDNKLESIKKRYTVGGTRSGGNSSLDDIIYEILNGISFTSMFDEQDDPELVQKYFPSMVNSSNVQEYIRILRDEMFLNQIPHITAFCNGFNEPMYSVTDDFLLRIENFIDKIYGQIGFRSEEDVFKLFTLELVEYTDDTKEIYEKYKNIMIRKLLNNKLILKAFKFFSGTHDIAPCVISVKPSVDGYNDFHVHTCFNTVDLVYKDSEKDIKEQFDIFYTVIETYTDEKMMQAGGRKTYNHYVRDTKVGLLF